MIQRTGPDGREESYDDGVTWLLVDPSPGWVASRPPEAPPTPTVEAAVAALAALTAEATLQAHADRVTPAQADTLSALITPWAPGQAVEAGDLRSHDHTIWEAIQGHTTQADWPPPDTPALWRRWRTPDTGPEPWVAPTGQHDAYGLGDQVTHAGHTWTSTAADNVWEPGVYGWTQT